MGWRYGSCERVPALWAPSLQVQSLSSNPSPNKRKKNGQALVADTYNPSYWEGRDLEDCGLKPPQAIVWKTLSWKKTYHKKGWQSGSSCNPWGQRSVPKKQVSKKQWKKNRHFRLGKVYWMPTMYALDARARTMAWSQGTKKIPNLMEMTPSQAHIWWPWVSDFAGVWACLLCFYSVPWGRSGK
jgi:hypothetical protein